MSDQGTPETSDSPPDWEERYKELQSTYTKTSQEAAELRQYQELVEAMQSDDPEAQAHAAEVLGIEFVGESQPEKSSEQALVERLERLESHLGSKDEQEAMERLQEQDADLMDTALEGFETKLGRELTKDEVELLVGHALINRTEDGNPGIEQAIGLYEGIDKSAQSRWASSKRVTTPTEGREGTEKQDLDESHSARVARMMQRYDLNNRQ